MIMNNVLAGPFNDVDQVDVSNWGSNSELLSTSLEVDDLFDTETNVETEDGGVATVGDNGTTDGNPPSTDDRIISPVRALYANESSMYPLAHDSFRQPPCLIIVSISAPLFANMVAEVRRNEWPRSTIIWND